MFKSIYILTIVFYCLSFILPNGDFASAEKNDSLAGPHLGAAEPVIVLELFTSQGCSSCPPADELLQEVKEEYSTSVYALSYHVDYWNYIGWKDPFSQSRFTENQRRYNIKFRNKSNYTPQLVVNGKEHFVGSDASKMYSKIASYQKRKPENSIRIHTAEKNEGLITLDYEVQGPTANRRMRMLLVLDERITKVKRGENRNRTLRNSNIVVHEKNIPLKDTKGSVSIDIPKIVRANENISLILLVEKENLDIVGASKLPLEN